jgi:choice-of-anchor A domain-containing protein
MTAALLATTGVAAVGLALPEPAAAAYPETVNPFAIGGGFTVYAREDALLQNQETEGSIAAGGTATVAPSAAQYTIIHVSAGTGDYDLPTVDGDPTRLLVGQYSTASTGILAITSAGTDDPALWGDLKMVQRDGGWQAFGRADWLRLNQNPSNADQTPLIDATHQKYPANAAPPAGATGNGSVYTANTGTTAVADYVEANRDASWEEASSCLADIADPTGDIGHHVGVAEDAGSRKVLEPLSPDQPNVVDYAAIAGAALLQFSPGPTPGASNPLVIRVPAGTTEVIGARADPQGAFSPYIMWDLSALTGDVTMTAAEGRIDGSVYAPDASVTVDAAPLDGQVVGLNVTLKGGEVHSFLFSSEITCAADGGTFAVRKELSGIEPSDLPEGTTFTVNYVATAPDDTVTTGSLEVPADGTPVVADDQFPLGTVVEFD